MIPTCDSLRTVVSGHLRMAARKINGKLYEKFTLQILT